jgi:hypothetical protein
MVQSEAEIIKMTTLFQKVLYKWLEGRRFPQFNIEVNLPSYTFHVNSSSLVVTTYRGNGHLNLSVSIRLDGNCPPYDFWVNGVADYDITSGVRFYKRDEVQFEFWRKNLGTDSYMWYPYVSEILSNLNESQRFALEMTLRDILTQLDREVEFRKGLS